LRRERKYMIGIASKLTMRPGREKSAPSYVQSLHAALATT